MLIILRYNYMPAVWSVPVTFISSIYRCSRNPWMTKLPGQFLYWFLPALLYNRKEF